jgi:hypothetical protein
MSDIEDRLAEIEGHLSVAHQEIGDVAADVRVRWRMSIPPRPDYDTDLIISRALDDGEKVASALRAVLTTADPDGMLVSYDANWVAGYMDAMEEVTAAITTALGASEAGK